ncbi:Amine sulfotransferase [Halotydeus destructor]|nr:Amine sulfotransferase [Halotydeus destructor]
MYASVVAIFYILAAVQSQSACDRYKQYLGPLENVGGLSMQVSPSNGLLYQAFAYQPRDDDVFVATFPKCGTTWVQQICTLLFNNGTTGSSDTVGETINNLSPIVDYEVPKVKVMKRPGIIKTHLDFLRAPWNPKAKYIVVIRNPKDVMISHFFYKKNFGLKMNVSVAVSDYTEYFLTESSNYGNYFQWYLSWLPAFCRKNVLLVVYEEMIEDSRREIIKMANFLGVDYDEQLIDTVLEKSSKKYMKKQLDDSMPGQAGGSFVRKGIVGDWRSHLSKPESLDFDAAIERHFGDTRYKGIWQRFDVAD